MMIIRAATLEDIEGIARVHVDSWRSTYKGIVSESYLSSLSVEKRKKSWEEILNHLSKDDRVFVSEDEGRIVGFANGGKNRLANTEYDGELYAIYLLEEYQGKGIGNKLVQEVVNTLKANNYNSMMVWVLEANPAIGFYRKLGGEEFTREEIKIGEDAFIEVALGWKNIGNNFCQMTREG